MAARAADDTCDTVGLLEAARQFGISYELAKRLAREERPLTKGVRILKFGNAARPVYRVSKQAIQAALAAGDGEQ